MTRDGAVGIVTGYGLDDRGVGVRVPVESRIFFMFTPTLGANQPPVKWKKLHNEELHNLCSSPSTIRMLKSRRMRWAGISSWELSAFYAVALFTEVNQAELEMNHGPPPFGAKDKMSNVGRDEEVRRGGGGGGRSGRRDEPRRHTLSGDHHHHQQGSALARSMDLEYGEECLSRTHVFEWCKCFREGRERVENEPHDRRPRTSVTEPNTDRADALIRETRRITIKKLGAMLSISVSSVEDIMKYHLHYRKVNARWVPRTLTDVEKLCACKLPVVSYSSLKTKVMHF
ncbi:hypothetical protein B7P43_G02270 [Cryptotermes secundus]|uniref:Mos1 transposase HTH domain-containing protein n=1 Tax=Cryptotermes secundus TaxID=105785 RepID=A0A2J7QGA4_9NEOP|nr:hypothetical protein B7P43_G02270 [Cryptotermes secundus]